MLELCLSRGLLCLLMSVTFALISTPPLFVFTRVAVSQYRSGYFEPAVALSEKLGRR